MRPWLVGSIVLGWCCLEGMAVPVYGDPSCENTGLGYLTAPSLSPGHILRPSSIFVLPVLGDKGTDRIDYDFHWANVWNYRPNQYMIDGEWIRSTLRFSHAVRDDLTVGLAVPVVGRTGGFADSMIENFHSSFHLGNANRDQFPADRSLITVMGPDGLFTVAEGESWGIGDISFFAVSRLTRGTCLWPAIVVQGEVSLPSGDPDELRGTGSTAIALSTVASKRLGASPVISFVGLGFQYCDSENIGAIEFRDEQYTGLAGLEYQYSESLALLVQYLISSPVAREYFEFSDPSHEVSAGAKWRSQQGTMVELAVVENVAVFKNSADIGLHLAIGRGW